MFDSTISLGSVIAAVSVLGGWYLKVRQFRRADAEARAAQHEENQRRLVAIERHLGGPNERPLAERMSVVETKVTHLEKRISE